MFVAGLFTDEIQLLIEYEVIQVTVNVLDRMCKRRMFKVNASKNKVFEKA